MSLIKTIPVIEYGDYNLKDISKRIVISDYIKNDPTVYQIYQIEGDESAENIAQDFYGESSLYWLVYLMNDIIDPFYGWLLSQSELDDFISNKYPGNEFGIHHKDVTANIDVTNTEYEEDINDAKRRIKLIRPSSIRNIKTLIRSTMRDNS